jgi:uncharacterized protein (TIGR03083 family)
VTLSRELVIPGMLEEYQAFVDLVKGCPAKDWERQTRCEGWRVADVSAHVIGQLTDVVSLRLEGLGTPEVTARQVEERCGRSPLELANELEVSSKTAAQLADAFDEAAWEQPAPGGTTGTLGFGMESLWFDTFLHADDIRNALGLATRTGAGLLASVSHIAQVLTDRHWEPATLNLEGMPEFVVSGGVARRVTGDPMTFVLVATGRSNPLQLGLDDSVNIYG